MILTVATIWFGRTGLCAARVAAVNPSSSLRAREPLGVHAQQPEPRGQRVGPARGRPAAAGPAPRLPAPRAERRCSRLHRQAPARPRTPMAPNAGQRRQVAAVRGLPCGEGACRRHRRCCGRGFCPPPGPAAPGQTSRPAPAAPAAWPAPWPGPAGSIFLRTQSKNAVIFSAHRRHQPRRQAGQLADDGDIRRPVQLGCPPAVRSASSRSPRRRRCRRRCRGLHLARSGAASSSHSTSPTKRAFTEPKPTAPCRGRSCREW